jgi:hypothetical protein
MGEKKQEKRKPGKTKAKTLSKIKQPQAAKPMTSLLLACPLIFEAALLTEIYGALIFNNAFRGKVSRSDFGKQPQNAF